MQRSRYVYQDPWDYDIFSYGTIDASITADNPSEDPYGGRVGSVAAKGAIDGRISAAHSIVSVASETSCPPW